MKNSLCLYSVLIIFSLSISSCLRDDCVSTREYAVYNPIYMNLEEIRNDDVKIIPERSLENPGKLYFYKNHLWINEMGKGVHIYDIADRANPDYVAFYEIPGNFDIAIRNDLLFADNSLDLIAIDIADFGHPKVVDRVENYKNEWVPEDQNVIVYYAKANRMEVIDCSDPDFGRNNFWRGGNVLVDFANFDAAAPTAVAEGAAGGGDSGIGGSFARFTLYDQFLYTVNNSQLNVWSYFGNNLAQEAEHNLGWGIETIFPYEDKLFIGSASGMYVFDNSNPESPQFAAEFEHARACDPVVVSNDVAYVTLRNGSECQGFVNQLDVIDVSNIYSPKLIKSYPMTNPHGLSVTNNTLFLGEGSYGLKVLDVTDSADIKEKSFNKDIATYDVIALSASDVMVVGEDGFYLIDASDQKNVKVVSHIAVDKS